MEIHSAGFLLNNRYINSSVNNRQSSYQYTDVFEQQSPPLKKHYPKYRSPKPTFKRLIDLLFLNKKVKENSPTTRTYIPEKHFSEQSLELFNNLYEKYNSCDEKDIAGIEKIVARIDGNKKINKTQYIYDLCLNVSEHVSVDDLSDIICYCETNPKIPEKLLTIFNKLNAEDKKDIAKILKSFQLTHRDTSKPIKMKKLKLFEKVYPKYIDKINAVSIAKRISALCAAPGGDAAQLVYLLERFKYLANVDDEKNLLMYMDMFLSYSIPYSEKVNNAKFAQQLIECGISRHVILNNFNNGANVFNTDYTIEERQRIADLIKKLRAMNINEETCLYNLIYIDSQLLEEVLDLRNEAIKRKDILATAGEELSDKEIDDVFFNMLDFVIDTAEVIGKDAMLYSFAEKLDNVEAYFHNIGGIDKETCVAREQLIQLTNPIKSELYKNYETEIRICKESLKTLQAEEERKDCINNINTITKKRNDLVNNAIKDPKDKLEAAQIFAAIWQAQNDENLQYNEFSLNVEDILPYMNPKTKEEKNTYYQKLNDMIFAVLETSELTEQTKQRLPFKDSKYLSKLFQADKDFKENFKQIIELLNKNPNKPNLEIFNSLSQNIETKAQFKQLGLNYDNWVKFNPDSKMSITVRTDLEKQRQSAIKNLEADFNDDLFKKLPDAEIEKLKKALQKEDFYLIEKYESTYDGDGVLKGSKKVLKLYKNNNPIEFSDLHKIIKLIKEEMNTNEFWNKNSHGITMNYARETIKNHILKLRYNEVKIALDKKADKDINLVIQKADMNDITHALFLGNDAACCTAVGTGCNQWCAPNYIKNKLVSAIEVKDGENYVGNTMMYVIKIDGKPALLLDNIELKPKYQYNDKIRDAIFDYAQIVAKDIGMSDMPIYAGPNRHKVNMNDYKLKAKGFVMVGTSGSNSIYLDFDTDEHVIGNNCSFHEELYRIR